MKKCRVMALISAATLLLTACGKTKTESGSLPIDEGKFIDMGSMILKQLNQKQYSNIIESMNESSKKQIKEKSLDQVWNEIEPTLGEFVQIVDTRIKSNSKAVEVYVTAEYKYQGFLLSLAYDQNDKLQGLFMSYAPIDKEPISNDIYEENKVAIGNEPFSLNGILTLPKNVEKPPVVILVQGSGSTDMDETNGKAGIKPFKDLAEELAKQGIATLRYDKRFYTYPHLSAEKQITLTIQDEVLDDVYFAIKLMQTNGKVDNAQIYVLGHSLGGMLAPKIAQDHPILKGIILMAGSPRGLDEIIVDQTKAAMSNLGTMNEKEKEDAIKISEQQSQQIQALKDTDKEKKYFGLPNSYWLSLNAAKGKDIVSELTLKMLVLQGKADFQVYADKDYVQWQELLKGKVNVEFHLYEGLNHMFMPSNLQDLSDYDRENHIDPKVIEDIATFILK